MKQGVGHGNRHLRLGRGVQGEEAGGLARIFEKWLTHVGHISQFSQLAPAASGTSRFSGSWEDAAACVSGLTHSL